MVVLSTNKVRHLNTHKIIHIHNYHMKNLSQLLTTNNHEMKHTQPLLHKHTLVLTKKGYMHNHIVQEYFQSTKFIRQRFSLSKQYVYTSSTIVAYKNMTLKQRSGVKCADHEVLVAHEITTVVSHY